MDFSLSLSYNIMVYPCCVTSERDNEGKIENYWAIFFSIKVIRGAKNNTLHFVTITMNYSAFLVFWLSLIALSP